MPPFALFRSRLAVLVTGAALLAGCLTPGTVLPMTNGYVFALRGTAGLSFHLAEGQPMHVNGWLPLRAHYGREGECGNPTLPDAFSLQRDNQAITVRSDVETMTSWESSGCFFGKKQLFVWFSDVTASATPVWTLIGRSGETELGRIQMSPEMPDPMQGFPRLTVTRDGDALALTWTAVPGAQKYELMVFDAPPDSIERNTDTSLGLIPPETTSQRIDLATTPSYAEQTIWQAVSQARQSGKPLTFVIRATAGADFRQSPVPGQTNQFVMTPLSPGLHWTHVSAPVTVTP